MWLWPICLAARPPITLSLGPSSLVFYLGSQSKNLAREFTHAGETNQYEKACTESRNHPLTVYLITYQGCPVLRQSVMPRVGWFFTEDQLAFCPVSALSTPYQWTMHSVKEIEWESLNYWMTMSYPQNHIKFNYRSLLSCPPTPSTFTQLTVRTLWTSVYILLHYVPCTFDPSVLDSLLSFYHSCVQLWTQLQLYLSSISAFVYIWV